MFEALADAGLDDRRGQLHRVSRRTPHRASVPLARHRPRARAVLLLQPLPERRGPARRSRSGTARPARSTPTPPPSAAGSSRATASTSSSSTSPTTTTPRTQPGPTRPRRARALRRGGRRARARGGRARRFLERYAIIVDVRPRPDVRRARSRGWATGSAHAEETLVAASNRAGHVYRLGRVCSAARAARRAARRRSVGRGRPLPRGGRRRSRGGRARSCGIEATAPGGRSRATRRSSTIPTRVARAWRRASRCPNAGEVLVSAADGWEFADLGGRHHLGGGSHGSLLAGDSARAGARRSASRRRPRAASSTSRRSILDHFGVGVAAYVLRGRHDRRVDRPAAARGRMVDASCAAAGSRTSACSPRWSACRARLFVPPDVAARATTTRRSRSARARRSRSRTSSPRCASCSSSAAASACSTSARARATRPPCSPSSRRDVVSIERVPELAERARARARVTGHGRSRSGSATAGSGRPTGRRSTRSPSRPRRRRCRRRSYEQLADGGRLVLPRGGAAGQRLVQRSCGRDRGPVERPRSPAGSSRSSAARAADPSRTRPRSRYARPRMDRAPRDDQRGRRGGSTPRSAGARTGSSSSSSASSARRATPSTSPSTPLLLRGLDLHYVPAAIGSFLVAVTNNYLWNRAWTFRAQRGHVVVPGARFLVVSTLALGANLLVLHLLVAGSGSARSSPRRSRSSSSRRSTSSATSSGRSAAGDDRRATRRAVARSSRSVRRPRSASAGAAPLRAGAATGRTPRRGRGKRRRAAPPRRPGGGSRCARGPEGRALARALPARRRRPTRTFDAAAPALDGHVWSGKAGEIARGTVEDRTGARASRRGPARRSRGRWRGAARRVRRQDAHVLAGVARALGASSSSGSSTSGARSRCARSTCSCCSRSASRSRSSTAATSSRAPPLAVPPLVYLLVRMPPGSGSAGARGRAAPTAPVWPVWVLAVRDALPRRLPHRAQRRDAARGDRRRLRRRDRRRPDPRRPGAVRRTCRSTDGSGAAGPADADGEIRERIQANGRCESANPRGDTYGPVALPRATFRPSLAFGWSGQVGRAARGARDRDRVRPARAARRSCSSGDASAARRLAAALAFGWAAYPFTALRAAREHERRADARAPRLGLLARVVARRARGSVGARRRGRSSRRSLVAPLWLTYPARARRRDASRAFVARLRRPRRCSPSRSCSSSPPSGTRSATFWDRTIAFQLGRDSPFSIWDWGQYHARGIPDLALAPDRRPGAGASRSPRSPPLVPRRQRPARARGADRGAPARRPALADALVLPLPSLGAARSSLLALLLPARHGQSDDAVTVASGSGAALAAAVVVLPAATSATVPGR